MAIKNVKSIAYYLRIKKMDNFSQSLKNNNLKLTAARKIVFDALSDSSTALSPKELFKQVAKKTDLVSVYRNLNLFSEIGIAHRFQDGKYTLCQHKHDDRGHHAHVHIIVNCLSCGLTEEINEHSQDICDIASRLKKYSQPLKAFESLVLQGQCSKCEQ